jgi:hypothetical protein
VSCSVLSASVGLGRSSTFGESARAVPNGPLLGRPPRSFRPAPAGSRADLGAERGQRSR